MPNSLQQISSEDSDTTLGLFFSLYVHLRRRRRLQLGAALLLMFASAVAEVVSLGAVVPFLGVLSDKQQIWKIPFIRVLTRALGITSSEKSLSFVALLFVLTILVAAAIRLLNLWLNGRLAAAIGSDLSCEAYLRTLHQPYIVHIQRNSSKLITGITVQIAQTVQVLNAILQLIAAFFVALGLLVGLLAINPLLALISISVFGSAYLLLTFTVRRRLSKNSLLISKANQSVLKALQEGFGAVRDVLLDGNQSTYVSIYNNSDRPMRFLQAQNAFLGASPRYILEALGLFLITLLALFLSWQRGNSTTVLPLLGTLALGSQKLLPALQQIYASWSTIKSREAAVTEVLEILNQPATLRPQHSSSPLITLKKSLRFESVSFGYGSDSPLVLKDVDFNINSGERIGLIGSTGSGKSTLVDLMMGLLEPINGRILVDGVDLNDPTRLDLLTAWRAGIAHVPQSIFLADSSIAENIAFGIPKNQIDYDRVHLAAQKAQISSFVDSSTNGYDTFVGERGVRLSGGQRQRIGIARALYKNVGFLVLDEATSALDVHTEEAVMNALDSLSDKLTVILIAHRLSTLAKCDRIFELTPMQNIRHLLPSDVL